MVVAATNFYKALSDPLQAIQDLYGEFSSEVINRSEANFGSIPFPEKQGDKQDFSSVVGKHFDSLFQEKDARAKVCIIVIRPAYVD